MIDAQWSVHDLFALPNEHLLEAWKEAKLSELEARFTTVPPDEALKLQAQIIRLVISFRLMGRAAIQPTSDEP